MKCERVQEMMGAYLYGDLAPDEMRDVRLHTQDCEACREDVVSRGKYLAEIPSVAPELTDDERMQIAWGVKGAIRSAAGARQVFGIRRGHIAAAASVAVAGLAVAALVVYNSPKGSSQAGAPRTTSRVIVELRRDPNPPRKEPAAGHRTQANATSGTSEKRRPRSDSDGLSSAIRQFGRPAITSRDSRQKKHVNPDKPAKVIDQPQPKEPEPIKEGTKLPEPTGLNDARTTTE